MGKRIAVFGGTFDPWTPGHQAIVEQVLKDGIADEVKVVPTVVNWHRSGDEWLGFDDRVAVIKAIAARSAFSGKISVDRREIDWLLGFPEGAVRDAARAGRRFLHTLLDIRKDFPDDELLVVIGTDQAEKFKEWFEYQKIYEIAKIVAVQGRDGKELNFDHWHWGFLPEATVKIPNEFRVCSATEIRGWYKGRTAPYYIDHFGERMLKRTPIFDLVERPMCEAGFKPVRVNSPDWVTVVAKKGGKVVTVSQKRFGLDVESVEHPCGMVEPGEQPIYAAKRELAEETGIQIKGADKIAYLGKVAANPAFMSNFMHYFYVDLDSAEWTQAEPKPDEHERLTVEWRDFKEFETKTDGESVFKSACALKLREKGLI